MLSLHTLSQDKPYVFSCLTSRVAAVGVHEGVGHPFVLLERALLCHVAVQRAQLLTLLLSVGHGRLVDDHLLPAAEMTARRREDGEQQQRPAEKGKSECITGKGDEKKMKGS